MVFERLLVAPLIFLFPLMSLAEQGVYQTQSSFLSEVFETKVPAAKVLWLKGELKQDCQSILGHPYSRLRVKYWKDGGKTAWILGEIGKEKPITVGLVIEKNALSQVKVLAFRESRGWEIKHPFFTRQFKGITLTPERQLDKHIDGISGATLSVRALKKLARMALHLNQHIQHNG